MIRMTENARSLIGTVLVAKWGRTGNCRLLHNGHNIANAGGGNYDKVGAVLAEWVKMNLFDEIKTLPAYVYDSDNREFGFYGLTFCGGKRRRYTAGDGYNLDGACGVGSMRSILNALGLTVRQREVDKNTDILVITEADSYSYKCAWKGKRRTQLAATS